MSRNDTVDGHQYRHYKGGIYTLICRATKESSGMQVIVYQGQDQRIWVRSEVEFFETVEWGGQLISRFTPVKI